MVFEMTFFRSSATTTSSSSTATVDIRNSFTTGGTATSRKPPRLLVRKRSSSSSTVFSNTMAHRNVHWAPEPAMVTVEMIDHVTPEEEEQVWYPMNYLQATRKEEIKNNLRAQYFANKTSTSSPSTDNTTPTSIIEDSTTMTWRGMEDILEKYNKKEKVYQHVSAVLTKYELQKDPHCPKSQASLSKFAHTLSKSDRKRARHLGEEDALLVGAKTATRRSLPNSTGNPLAVFGKSLKKQVRRSLSPFPGVGLSARSSYGSPTQTSSRIRSRSRSRGRPKGHRKTTSFDVGTVFNWKLNAGTDSIETVSSSTRTAISDGADATVNTAIDDLHHDDILSAGQPQEQQQESQ